jgi:amino acid permease
VLLLVLSVLSYSFFYRVIIRCLKVSEEVTYISMIQKVLGPQVRRAFEAAMVFLLFGIACVYLVSPN